MSTITYQVPAIGSEWTEDDGQQASLVAGATPFQREKRLRRRVEVFGTTRRIVTRARVTYLEHTVIERRGLDARRQRSPIEGKRYVLDATEGTLAILGEDGAPVSPEEDAAVRAEEQRFGRAENLPMLLGRLDLREHEPVEVPAATAARLFPGDLEVETMVLTLVAHAGQDAAFALRLAMRGVRNGIESRTELAGTLVVDSSTAQTREMKLVGPIRLTGAFVAEGTLELTSVRSPSVPPGDPGSPPGSPVW